LGTCSGDGTTACGTTADCAVPGGSCQAGDCQTAFPGGQTIFQWVAALNSGSFAGHSDWRVPSMRELQSIVDYENAIPAVSTAFNTNCSGNLGCTVTTCSCTASLLYWTSSTYPNNPLAAWSIYFNDGQVLAGHKGARFCVRAVRGGS
jgi:hypothetical protein